MIQVKLKNRTLQIPNSWESLTRKQFLYTIQVLINHIQGQLSKLDVRILLLIQYTGYQPSRKLVRVWPSKTIYYSRMQIAAIRYRLFYKKSAYKSLMHNWIRNSRPEPESESQLRENITHNLVAISEKIAFPWRQENGQTIINTMMLRNPIPFIRIRTKKVQGLYFNIGIITQTNITARQFADAFDISRAFAQSQDARLLNHLCAILYPGNYSHANAVNSNYHERFTRVPFIVRYAVYLWFTGVTSYFVNHPVYSLLFNGSKNDNPDRISLGLSESILQLSLTGFGGIDEMSNQNVITFFDAQVKSLKKTISDALGKGVKKEELPALLNLSISQIDSLC